MDINTIYIYFITGFAGVAALTWTAQIVVSHKSTFIKKVIAGLLAGLVGAILSVLAIPLYDLSLIAGRLAFVALNIFWLKVYFKKDWANTMLTYTLATMLVLPSAYIASYTSTLYPSSSTYQHAASNLVAVGLAVLLPVRAVYNFFVDRVSKSHTFVLSLAVGAALMYTTHVTMGEGGNVVFNAMVATAVVVVLLIFSLVAKHLSMFRNVQIINADDKKSKHLKSFINKITKR